VLSGKIMFRDVVYITYDYTVRVQDGWMIFRWWRAYVPKNACDDLSHSDTRLSLMLNGFELHMYNRTSLYSNLEKIFGIEPHLTPKDDEPKQGKIVQMIGTYSKKTVLGNCISFCTSAGTNQLVCSETGISQDFRCRL